MFLRSKKIRGETMHKVVKNKRTGRFTVMEQVPEKVGKFGEWKITGGGFKTKEEAESFIGE